MELSHFVISLAKLKKSLTVNSLWVKGSKNGIKNFARLYPGVLITERIGLNLGILSTTDLSTFGFPYKIPCSRIYRTIIKSVKMSYLIFV